MEYHNKLFELNAISIIRSKPNKLRNVQSHDKAFMDMTLGELKYLTSTCWKEKLQPLTIDMTEDEFTGRY